MYVIIPIWYHVIVTCFPPLDCSKCSNPDRISGTPNEVHVDMRPFNNYFFIVNVSWNVVYDCKCSLSLSCLLLYFSCPSLLAYNMHIIFFIISSFFPLLKLWAIIFSLRLSPLIVRVIHPHTKAATVFKEMYAVLIVCLLHFVSFSYAANNSSSILHDV